MRSLARASGRSYGFVRTVLSEAGTRLRARGGANRRRTTTDTHSPDSSAETPDSSRDMRSPKNPRKAAKRRKTPREPATARNLPRTRGVLAGREIWPPTGKAG
ncbi:helix-turn-helix domain-containing protein [Actinopolyspora saharensis]|uniref:helix-turn-helix domain-containing protein n=1 Tax=Actinopolyspora saharensis TaxID=995062 RepID=UPI003CCBC8BD